MRLIRVGLRYQFCFATISQATEHKSEKLTLFCTKKRRFVRNADAWEASALPRSVTHALFEMTANGSHQNTRSQQRLYMR